MPNLSSHIQTFSVLDAPYAGNDMNFESMDGFYTVLSGGAQLIFSEGAWYASATGTISDSLNLIKRDAFPLYSYTWDKRRQLRLRLSSQVIVGSTGFCYLMCGMPFAPWTGFGLVFTPTQIIARCGDGIDIADLVLFTGLTPGVTYEHLYEFIFYPGNGVYVYVDGVLIGSIITFLPSGTTASDRILTIEMLNEAVFQGYELGFSRIQFSQDK